MVIADILLIAVVLIALIFASIVDLKIKEVPDWLNFALIIIALFIRLIHAIVTSEWNYFLYGVYGFGAMFLLGLALFYTKQWGGGDTKLLMGLGAVFATKPFYIKPLMNVPFVFVMIVNLMIVGALYSILWSVIILIKNRKKIGTEVLKQFVKKRKMRYMYFLFTLVSLVLVFTAISSLQFLMIAITFLFLIYPYLFIIIKAVETVGMLKWVKPKDLVEGDWVAKEVKVKGKIICCPKDLGLEKHQIVALKKAKVKEVLIKDGIAFVPSLLLGVIITLIYGNFVFLLI